MSREINLIIAAQEYEGANHKELWIEMSKQSKNLTIVVDISADMVVSIAKKKFYRIKDSLKGAKKVNNNLIIFRPLFIIRPEIANNIINNINAKMFKIQLSKLVENINSYKINVLHYGGEIPTIIKKSYSNSSLFYFIMDEVRNDAHSDGVNLQRLRCDKLWCDESKHIFLMSEKLKENRSKYISKLTVIGNGASKKVYSKEMIRENLSIGIIGNIRNWIDKDLLKDLIELRKDLNFGFVGNIEENMKEYIEEIITKNNNVEYYGKVEKNEVHNWYRKFNVIIVPYIQNEFMKATRPIKIVESIFAGTPVVSIPISGYDECQFIKFAKNLNEFSKNIDSAILEGIDTKSKEYKDFIKFNSWEYKANQILSYMKS